MPSSPQTPSEAFVESPLPQSPAERRFNFDGGSYVHAEPDEKGDYEQVIAPRNVRNEGGKVVGIRPEAGWWVKARGKSGGNAMVVIASRDGKFVKPISRRELDSFTQAALEGKHGPIAGLPEKKEAKPSALEQAFAADAGERAVAASVPGAFRADSPSKLQQPELPDPRIALRAEPTNEPRLETESQQQEKINQAAARERIAKVLGENMKGGGALGDLLRQLSSTPDQMMLALQADGAIQEAVMRELRMRVQQLSGAKNSLGQPVFQDGVREDRDRDVAKASSLFKKGIINVKSFDYVAAIAYDMLSGQFDVKSDKTSRDAGEFAHHRDAAEKVLADFAKDQVIEQANIYVENPELKRALETAGRELGGLYNEFYTAQQQLTDLVETAPLNMDDDLNRIVELAQGLKRNLMNAQSKLEDTVRRVNGERGRIAEHTTLSTEEESKVTALLQDMQLVGANIQGVFPMLTKAIDIIGQLPYEHRPEALPHELRSWLGRNHSDVDLALERAKNITAEYRR